MSAKTDTRDPSRRVQFDEAGEGAYLLLRNAGIRSLQGYYDKDHLNIVERAFLTVDVPVIEKLLTIMVWKGDKLQEKVTLDDFDDVPLEQVVNKLRDAWSLSLNGRTYMQQVEYVREEARRLTQDPRLTNPAAGSEASAEPLTEPA